MIENKSTIFGIIALIIGASGLGLGAFSVISIQMIEGEQGPPGEDGLDGEDGLNGIDGINGTDGLDAPGYYCNSAEEVQQALDSIGEGTGRIIINQSITLSSKINISGGGSYVIEGVGPGITIDCNGDRSAFDITNTTSCIIKNIMINSSKITLSIKPIINIDEINNNPVYIEKIQIMGDSDLTGYGIYIESGNVRIIDCFITKVQSGIYQSSGDYNYICGNSLDTGFQPGIRISGSFNMIADNFIRNYEYGIHIRGDNNTIKDNTIHSIQFDGIYVLDCDNNIISGNYLSDVGTTGIYMDTCNFIEILENHISSFGAYGICLVDCQNNLISVNQIFYGNHDGISLHNGHYNVVTGNSICNLSSSSTTIAGIKLYTDSDFNAILSNAIFNCTCYSGFTGYGIYISLECDDTTVIGNTSLDNEDNWQNYGINTFGNETNNNFG